MTYTFDVEIIDKFRKIVNHPVIKKKYINVNGNNFWNIMCSAMDWIEVSAHGIPEINIKQSPFTSYKTSLNLMQFVMAIDSIAESITQLYRVIWKKDDYPLKLDKSIFMNEYLTDDKYFKHLRAAFAAHPVNLNSHDGLPKAKDDKEKWYASWSTSSFSPNNDFEVRLYSNLFKKNDEYILQLNINQLYLYALKRYSLLSDLTKTLSKEIDSHNKSSKAEKIISTKEPLEQLDILIQENEKRFPFGGGYAYVLIEIRDLLTEDIKVQLGEQTNEQIRQYKNVLLDLIPLIKSNLQKMTIDYGNYSYLLTPATHTLDNQNIEEIHKYKYIIRKIYEYFNIPGRVDAAAILDIEEISVRGIVSSDILKIHSKVGQKLLFNAAFFQRNKEKGIFPKD